VQATALEALADHKLAAPFYDAATDGKATVAIVLGVQAINVILIIVDLSTAFVVISDRVIVCEKRGVRVSGKKPLMRARSYKQGGSEVRVAKGSIRFRLTNGN